MIEEFMVWNGDNTEDVVKFCVDWQYELCSIYSITTNLLNGKPMVRIEPADTMRNSCVYVCLGDTVIRKQKSLYHKYIEVLETK